MPHAHTNTAEADVIAFAQIPPPPYPGTGGGATAGDNTQMDYDLSPMPQALNRPRLPVEKRNPHLQNLPEDISIVKFQTIVRDGREIVVGRIKIPTSATNHAFILRRYDTDAISLTTMYKVAFPGADEDDERREMDWVKSSFDTRFTNGGRDLDAVRLAGQWVSRHLAVHLAPAYGMGTLIQNLARAFPDPNVAYRRSLRSQAAHDEMHGRQDQIPSLSTPTGLPEAKRQRVDSQASTTAAAPASAAGPASASAGDRHLTLEATTTITAPAAAARQTDMEAEIAQAKQMVLDLKKELRLRAAAGEDLEDQGVYENTRGVKRGANADEGVTMSSGAGKTDRVIRRNKRVEAVGAGNTGRRVAWGAVMFGLGIGAAAFLPQLAAQVPAFAAQFF